MTSKTTIGVYRWDAYHGGDGAVYRAVIKCLSPEHYRDKLPFFSAIRPDGRIEANGIDDPAKVDAEIGYAKEGGVDYWIFLRYIDKEVSHGPMNAAYHSYMRSSRKKDVKFCWMLSHGLNTESAEFWDNEKQMTVEAMKDRQWIQVLGTRPLLYLYQDCGKESLAGRLEELRLLAHMHGLSNPYIVAISFDPKINGCDARTEWPQFGGAGDPAQNFSDVVAGQNRKLLVGDTDAVLAAHVNWDSRPYHDNPPPWWPDPPNAWYQMPSATEFRKRVKKAVDQSTANPDRCRANTIFVYAWNEFTEGGIMCPTLKRDGTVDTPILDGLAGVNRPYSLSGEGSCG